MQTSSACAVGLLFVAATLWSASSLSCASIGSGCIRNSDCSSGQICVASTCQLDPGSVDPQDAGFEAADSSQESSTLPVDSSKFGVEAEASDTSVTIPSPDAKSTDVSSDAADAPSESDALDSASDTAE